MIDPVSFAVFFFAWLFQAFTGFGAGIFIVGVLSLHYNPKVVVVSSAPVNLIGTLTTFLFLMRYSRPDLKILLPLIAGSVPGISIGTLLLVELDRSLLKLTIGTFILLLGIYDLTVQKRLIDVKLKRSALNSFMAGMVGGFFAGLVGMGGPPPVVYLNQVIDDPDVFKSTLSLFFTSNIVVRLISYSSLGGIEYFSPDMIVTALVSVPLGVFGGILLSRKLPKERFKVLVSVSVMILGALLLLEV